MTEWVNWGMVSMLKRNKKKAPLSSTAMKTSSRDFQIKWVNEHVPGISHTESYLNLTMTPFYRWENRDSQGWPQWPKVIQLVKAWFNRRALFWKPELGYFSPFPLCLPVKHSMIFQARSLSSMPLWPRYSARWQAQSSALHGHLQSWTTLTHPSVQMLSSLQDEGLEGTSRLLFYSQSKKSTGLPSGAYLFLKALEQLPQSPSQRWSTNLQLLSRQHFNGGQWD